MAKKSDMGGVSVRCEYGPAFGEPCDAMADGVIRHKHLGAVPACDRHLSATTHPIHRRVRFGYVVDESAAAFAESLRGAL